MGQERRFNMLAATFGHDSGGFKWLEGGGKAVGCGWQKIEKKKNLVRD